MQRRVAVWPDRVIGNAVKASVPVGLDASWYLHQRRGGPGETVGVVGVGGLAVILGVPGRAVPARRDGRRTVAGLEVAGLVGERDVVGVCRPDDPGLLGGGAVHRVEVVGDVVAGGAGRIVLDLAESVGRAGGHRTRHVGGQVLDGRDQAPAAV